MLAVGKEFKEWMGHVPRDRASIWYISPLISAVLFAAVVALFVAAALS